MAAIARRPPGPVHFATPHPHSVGAAAGRDPRLAGCARCLPHGVLCPAPRRADTRSAPTDTGSRCAYRGRTSYGHATVGAAAGRDPRQLGIAPCPRRADTRPAPTKEGPCRSGPWPQWPVQATLVSTRSQSSSSCITNRSPLSRAPTPAGVPVSTTSPGCRVK